MWHAADAMLEMQHLILRHFAQKPSVRLAEQEREVDELRMVSELGTIQCGRHLRQINPRPKAAGEGHLGHRDGQSPFA